VEADCNNWLDIRRLAFLITVYTSYSRLDRWGSERRNYSTLAGSNTGDVQNPTRMM